MNDFNLQSPIQSLVTNPDGTVNVEAIILHETFESENRRDSNGRLVVITGKTIDSVFSTHNKRFNKPSTWNKLPKVLKSHKFNDVDSIIGRVSPKLQKVTIPLKGKRVSALKTTLHITDKEAIDRIKKGEWLGVSSNLVPTKFYNVKLSTLPTSQRQELQSKGAAGTVTLGDFEDGVEIREISLVVIPCLSETYILNSGGVSDYTHTIDNLKYNIGSLKKDKKTLSSKIDEVGKRELQLKNKELQAKEELQGQIIGGIIKEMQVSNQISPNEANIFNSLALGNPEGSYLLAKLSKSLPSNRFLTQTNNIFK